MLNDNTYLNQCTFCSARPFRIFFFLFYVLFFLPISLSFSPSLTFSSTLLCSRIISFFPLHSLICSFFIILYFSSLHYFISPRVSRLQISKRRSTIVLSNTGSSKGCFFGVRKNSSLNKHTIQNLLSFNRLLNGQCKAVLFHYFSLHFHRLPLFSYLQGLFNISFRFYLFLSLST